MAKKTPVSAQEKRPARIAKAAAKAKPAKLYPLLVEAIELLAVAGRPAEVRVLLGWAYDGRLPPPKAVPSVLSTPMLDVLADALGAGDVTRGAPATGGGIDPRSHAERVAAAEAGARARVTGDAFEGMDPVEGWRGLPSDDRTRRICHWREAQRLAREGKDAAALDELADYVASWPAEQRGAGGGDELVLALDLATRTGRLDEASRWLAGQGERLSTAAFALPAALCLPKVARAALDGTLGAALSLALGDAAVGAALAAFDAAIGGGAPSGAGGSKAAARGAAPAKAEGTKPAAPPPGAKPAAERAEATKPPRVQKRRVTAEYSQVSIEPVERDAVEQEQVFFQRREESSAGFSLFPTQVGIATPSDTAWVDVEVRIEGAVEPDLEGVTRAVAVPLEVRGPLVVRSVSSDPDDPIAVPPGRYDVLVRFFPKKAPRAEAKAGLSVWTVRVSFHPEGSLRAPRTLRMDE